MTKETRYNCDYCFRPIENCHIMIKELRIAPHEHEIGSIDGPFDFCSKDHMQKFFEKYNFRIQCTGQKVGLP